MLNHDLKSAIRSLLGSRGYTMVAVASLGLAIGAIASGVGVVNALFARDIAIPEPQALVAIAKSDPERPDDRNPLLLSQFEAIRTRAQAFSHVFAWRDVLLRNVEASGTRYLGTVNEVSGEYFAALGVQPYLGRTFGPDEVATAGAGVSARVAVLDYRCWAQRFSRDPNVLGKVLVIDGVPLTIVGVMPPDFTGLNIVMAADATVPIGFETRRSGEGPSAAPTSPNYFVAARLKQGITAESAHASLQSIWPPVLEATVPATAQPAARKRFMSSRIGVESLRTGWAGGNIGLRRELKGPLTKLVGLSALVLLVAFVNLAGLILARMSARQQELGLRASLGASRFALARLAMVEALLVTVAGAVLGVVMAFWAGPFILHSLLRSAPLRPLIFDATPDLRVLAIIIAAALAIGILCALAPAWNIIGRDPLSNLRQNTRTVRRGLSTSQKALVCVQLSLAFVLTAAALLFGRSLYNLHVLQPGFRAEGVVTMDLMPQMTQRAIPNRDAYYRDLAETLSAVPGVDSVSYVLVTPLGPAFGAAVSDMDGGHTSEAIVNPIGPGFFRTLGMRMLAGRDIDWRDDQQAPKVAVISDSAAAQLFPGRDPIGQRLQIPALPFAAGAQVVGVVDSASLWKLRAHRPKAVYLALMQAPVIVSVSIALHTTGDTPAVARAVSRVIESKQHHFAFRTHSLTDQMQYALVDERVLSMFSVFFAGLTILLASAGLYGLLSYAVARRTPEIGVRMAVGARRQDVIRLVMRDAVWILLCSCVIGGPLVIVIFRLAADTLFGLSAHDPLTYLSAAAILTMFTLAAAYVPGRRASRIDAMQALRME
jgi:predicted permease